MSRTATVTRTTRETSISVAVNLDGEGSSSVETGVPFYDHLLEALAKHSLIDLEVRAEGDLHIDDHHTVEDVALALGSALAEAIGDGAGITRYGNAAVPMDEALATCALDLSGRPYAVLDLPFRNERIGNLTTQNIPHALESLARTGGLTLHLAATGRNDHHVAEAAFKALARSLRMALAIDPRRAGEIPSTKGSL